MWAEFTPPLHTRQVIDLHRNQLVGPIPLAFGGLLQVVTLDLSHNLLERPLPETIGGMQSLQQLLLSHNYLEGARP